MKALSAHSWKTGLAIAGLLAALFGSGAGVIGQVFRAPQGTAENLRFEQAGGVVTITYDLRSDGPNAVFTIVLEVAGPGGSAITPSSTSGDVGAGVRPGPGKRIVWAASRDVEDLQINQFKFNVRASAGAGVPVTPPPAAMGRLVVTSTPAGAAVFVDGTSRGTTPVTLAALPAGLHKVRVERVGYLENQRDVTVTPGGEAVIDVKLTAAAPPVPPLGATASTAGGNAQVAAPKGGGGKKWLWIGAAGAAVAGGAVALAGGGKDPGPTANSRTCTFAVVGLANLTVGAGAQNLTFQVQETNTPCSGGAWTATVGPNQSWLTVSPSTATVAGIASVGIAANSVGNRTTSLTIAGTTVQVFQDPLACTYQARFVGGHGVPPNTANTVVPGDCSGAGCGTRDVEVQANDASCAWSVDNTPQWFSLVNRPSPGTGTVQMQVTERNTTGRDRTASFRVAGLTFTVTQCAARCP